MINTIIEEIEELIVIHQLKTDLNIVPIVAKD